MSTRDASRPLGQAWDYGNGQADLFAKWRVSGGALVDRSPSLRLGAQGTAQNPLAPRPGLHAVGAPRTVLTILSANTALALGPPPVAGPAAKPKIWVI